MAGPDHVHINSLPIHVLSTTNWSFPVIIYYINYVLLISLGVISWTLASLGH